MLGHASRRADYHPFTSILQAAASRAWTRTSPARPRAPHRTTTHKHSFATGFGVLYGGESSKGKTLISGWKNSPSALLSTNATSTRGADYSVSDVSKSLDAVADSDRCAPLTESHAASTPATHDASPSGNPATAPAVPQTAAEVKESLLGVSQGAPHKVSTPMTHSQTLSFPVSSGDMHEDLWEPEDDPWDTYAMDRSDELATSAESTLAMHTTEEAQPPLTPATALQAESSTANRICTKFRESTPDRSFHRNLIELSASPLPPDATKMDRLNELIHSHDRHPQHHSTTSYNLLISLAIAIREFRTASTLFQAMSRRGICGDFESRKLSVRLRLRQGEWTPAWLGETGGGKHLLPLPLWLEFFGAVRILQPLSEDATWEEQRDHARKCAEAVQSRHSLLMRYRPALTAAQTATLPPRATFYLVRWILERGKRADAVDLTWKYFKQLPKVLSPVHRKYCTDIINIHLKTKAKDVSDTRTWLRRLLALHPDLRPDSDTLFIILGTIRTMHGNSVVFERIIRQFQKEWGEDIVDERILSLLANRARLDRYTRVLKNVIREYERRRDACSLRAWLPSSSLPQNPNNRHSHEMVFYTRQKEEARWKFYREHLSRLEGKQRARKDWVKAQKAKARAAGAASGST